MNSFINLSKSPTKELFYLSQDEYRAKFEKGWSFSFAYSLTELRNIYLFLEIYGFKNLADFTKICIQNNLFYERTPWQDRRILEQINALKNFQLITDDEKSIRRSLFSSSPEDPLSEDDLKVFKDIYFSYHRFREIHSWLVNPEGYNAELVENICQEAVLDKSCAIFPIRGSDRCVESFIFSLQDNATVYRIAKREKKDFDGMRRFWDVFVKWGTSLGLAATYNLGDFNYKLSSNFKPPSLFYFPRPIADDFDLLKYLLEKTRLRYVYIPNLVLTLASEMRFSVDDVKRLIIDTTQKYPQSMSLQKTSEILMRKTELGFTPKSNGFLFSHILLMR